MNVKTVVKYAWFVARVVFVWCALVALANFQLWARLFFPAYVLLALAELQLIIELWEFGKNEAVKKS